MILYEATALLDPSEQQAILDALLQEFAERSVIWAEPQRLGGEVRPVLVMRGGRVVGQGRYDELSRDGRALDDLIAAE